MTTNSLNQPINKSFLSNNKFEFVIQRLPHVQFFVQGVALPNISLTSTAIQTPFVQMNTPGNILTFDTLTINYIVDEDMNSWFEIYDWIVALGNPESLNKIGNLTRLQGQMNSVVSDATLLINSNSNNSRVKFTFKDLYPVELSGVQFSSTDTSQEFLTSTITFAYTYYSAEKI
jgi:hypothetical protein